MVKTGKATKFGLIRVLNLSAGLVVLGACWPNLWAADDVTVKADVDRKQVNVGETLTYVISISSSDGVSSSEPRLPNITAFSLLQTSKGSKSVSTFDNGKFETLRSLEYIYTLQAEIVGKQQIGAAEVVVDGKTHMTAPILIDVVAGGATAPPIAGGQPTFPVDPFSTDADDLFDQMLRRRAPPGGFKTQPANPAEAFFIQVEVDKTKVYEGEQVTASWYLYTRGNVLAIDTLKYPSLNGFWKEDIEVATRLSFENEMFDGVVYKKALLASYSLFPIKEGKAKVDGYKARCQVITPSNFGFGRAKYYTKSSKEIKIEVLPLPKVGQPADFTGAVGAFTVSAQLDSAQAKTDQPITLTIKFEGKGNAKLIDLPAIDFPKSFEVYDTQKQAKFFKDGRSYKEFKVLLIPREAGQFTVPAFTLSFFDPDLEAYYSKSVNEMTVEVLPGDGAKSIPESPLAESGPSQPKDVIAEPALSLAWSNPSILTPQIKVIAWGSVFSMILLFLGWRGRVEFRWGRKRQDLEQVVKLRFKMIYQHLAKDDWRQVGVGVMNTVYMVLGEVSGEKGASEEVDKMFLKAPPSVRREVAEPLKKLLQSFEILGFAPESVIGSLKEPKNLRKLVQEMEKVLLKAVRIGVGLEDSAASNQNERPSD